MEIISFFDSFFAFTCARNGKEAEYMATDENGDGVVVTDENVIRRAFVDHYKGIYGSNENCGNPFIEPGIIQDLPVLQQEEAEYMAQQPTDQGIIQTVFSIHPDRASGPDGINGRAVQLYWAEFGPSVMFEVKNFFQTAHLDANVATSNMVLVPKVESAKHVTDFRPISVCNFLYKVISKILANRMKRFIPALVSTNQTAFTPGRDISENMVVFREVMHSIKKRSFQPPSFCFKCDLSKAFDRMKWGFIFKVLAVFGFPGEFIQWIKACVTMARFSILINGKADGFITPKRGLRQGCALSPYLFILCMDIFTRMLVYHEQRGFIRGLKLSPAAPTLTSIMFADDLVIFSEASTQQALRVQEIINRFCLLSGQMVGCDKSRIWFSRNTPDSERQCIEAILNAQPGDDMHIYLGLPITASKPAHYSPLINKVQSKLQAWSAKTLSQAAKVVLIKSVVEPMVLFTAVGGPLPASVSSKLNSMIRSFFWENGGKQKMHLVAWEKIVKPKDQGGLGLRDVTVISRAMMLKLLWKLASKEHTNKPWISLLTAKYMSRRNLWLSPAPSDCTKLWRGILQVRDVLKPLIKWQVGKGDKCRVLAEPWHDYWQAFPLTNNAQLALHELLDDTGINWSHDKLASIFGTGVALHVITQYPQPPMAFNGREDRLIYTGASDGQLSFSHACLLVQGQHRPISSQLAQLFKVIWHCPSIMPQVRMFLWKMLMDAVPIRGAYAHRLGFQPPECSVCQQDEEVTGHALFTCPFSKACWYGSQFNLRTELLPTNIITLLFSICQSLQGAQFTAFANHVWALWKQRCAHVIEGKNLGIHSVHHLANHYNSFSKMVSAMHIPGPLKHIWKCHEDQLEETEVCFVDGSYKEPNEGGWAYIIWRRGILVQYGYRAGHASSPLATELLALRLAIQEAVRANLGKCTFYTDCYQLQQVIEGKIPVHTMPWEIFHDVSDLLLSLRGNQGFTCMHCPRDKNEEAHCLANYARAHLVNYTGFTFPLCATLV
ncbi:RNA-directed DNA polymerase (reverse transcriptase)-related family protein [Rhynchospora pubera]|uniref:RNA-directed DNA polymerase (Reverse transcriptase)-related family protein n=1 Tax=Rhynchospora pubera TaxID=906938 RepID=A0AAV8D5F5_9POAL|nr:RNA-directed DNA polymerase (reverse transcriptase)-related family protein [Rhynchospora pubera]